jgi:excisionase family DNA binding protein
MARDTQSFLTEPQAASYLSISLSTLRRWRRSGVAPRHFRLGSIIRYRLNDLDQFIATNLTKGVA